MEFLRKRGVLKVIYMRKECTNEIERQLQLPGKCELCGIGQKERERRKKSLRGTEEA